MLKRSLCLEQIEQVQLSLAHHPFLAAESLQGIRGVEARVMPVAVGITILHVVQRTVEHPEACWHRLAILHCISAETTE